MITAADSIPPWERNRESVVPVSAEVPVEFLPWRIRKPRKTSTKPQIRVVKAKPSPKPFVRPDYHEYIKSEKWQRKARKARRRAGGKCELCQSTYRIEVHHKHYRTLGQESMTDLQVLCSGCHSIQHENKRPARDDVSRQYREIMRNL
jgi:hypothetical protein